MKQINQTKKYEKLKMKELNQLFPEKGSSIKGPLCLTNERLDNQEQQVEVEFPLIRSCFGTIQFLDTLSF